ncbi:MAG: RNA 2',3'-cyclic phosphodiesterase [Candidatus Moranbacteria bacterium]|nr:RNA 2',3'-cyclic phosphodiesterase [Candidatus Moranbacteria bacterium]
MKTKEKRIFLALPLNKEIKISVVKLQQEYKALGSNINFIKPSNLHITLIPPWRESEVERLILKLKNFNFVQKSIVLEFNKVSFGPVGGKPRLIWLTGPPNRNFNRLVVNLARCLEIGLVFRKILPHLTIARFNPGNFDSFLEKNINSSISLFQEIKEYAIFESTITEKGADYKIVKRFDLS